MALIAILLTITIIRHPQVAFNASLNGLKLWLDVVLPALLPFFAMSEILMGLGVVHFIGVLLEPLMRPIFRIPGAGAFAVAMGLASGYPIGAKITGRLRREGLCNGIEGERLVSFANTADPLFMVGAVAVGMFGMEQLGWTIASAHYLSVVLIGFIMRFHGHGAQEIEEQSQKGNIMARALRELYDARCRDGRPLGELFGDAVRESFGSMLFVGGCIMIFSVIIRVLDVAGIIAVIGKILSDLLVPLGVDPELIPALLRGMFEITIGCEAASQTTSSLLQRTTAAGAIIAWSGFSVHAQVASMLHGTDIRIIPYIVARGLHGIFAAILTVLLWNPIGYVLANIPLPVLTSLSAPITSMTFLTRLTLSLQAAALIAALLVVLGVVACLLCNLRIIYLRIK